MTKLTKTDVFTATGPLKETLLDKTTRIVRKINDEEAEVSHAKVARLRKARFEKDQADET